MEYIVLKAIILAVVSCLLGYLIGKRTSYPYGGEIVFEKQPDGEEKCAFCLEQDEKWYEKQKMVVFKIEHRQESKQISNIDNDNT